MTPADLVQTAQAHGMPAIGLTDHNLLTGAIEFFTTCKQNGIQPLIGLEVDLGQAPIIFWHPAMRVGQIFAG